MSLDTIGRPDPSRGPLRAMRDSLEGRQPRTYLVTWSSGGCIIQAKTWEEAARLTLENCETAKRQRLDIREVQRGGRLPILYSWE